MRPLRRFGCLLFITYVQLAVGRDLEPRLSAADDLRVDLSTRVDREGQRPALQRTITQCLGTETLTRACHFENVYYDLNSSRFVHFGVAGATAAAFGDELRPGEPWLRLVKGDRQWRPGMPESGRQFFLDWRPGAPLPAAAEVASFARPLHLRAPYHTVSLGHLIRDNLQFLVELPVRFGREPSGFDWVRWASDMNYGDWQEESATAEHYRGLFNGRPSLTWQQVLDKALEGEDRSKVKYIKFSELIGGQGPADIASQVLSLEFAVNDTMKTAWAHMCDPFAFSEMRRVAYRNFNLQVRAAKDLKPFVLFLDGQPGERRHLVNAKELLPRLRAQFPGVRMQHTQISRRPLREQLQLLAEATVLVSNIGSRSFRLIYLPNGATTILIGPPEYTFNLIPPPAAEAAKRLYQRHGTVSEVTPHRIERPFVEIDWCWGFLGYVHMLRYRVTAPEEVVTEPWHTWTAARNADIVLNEGKLVELIDVALQRVEHSAAHRGGGALSAYAE